MSGKRRKLSKVDQAGKALRTFMAEGPYTFSETFRIAELCAADDAFEPGDFLDDIAEKFEPTELAKLLNPRAQFKPSDWKSLATWRKGIGDWHVKYITSGFRPAHLQEIAKSDDSFDSVMNEIKFWIFFTEAERYAILEIIKGVREREEHGDY